MDCGLFHHFAVLLAAPGRVVLKPRQRLAEEHNCAGRTSREWPQGLIDDGTPTHVAVEARADDVNATP